MKRNNISWNMFWEGFINIYLKMEVCLCWLGFMVFIKLRDKEWNLFMCNCKDLILGMLVVIRFNFCLIWREVSIKDRLLVWKS